MPEIDIWADVISENVTATLYEDGLLEASVSDEVLAEVRLDERTEEAARTALHRMLGEVGRAVPLSVEGEDFPSLTATIDALDARRH